MRLAVLVQDDMGRPSGGDGDSLHNLHSVRADFLERPRRNHDGTPIASASANQRCKFILFVNTFPSISNR